MTVLKADDGFEPDAYFWEDGIFGNFGCNVVGTEIDFFVNL